jgi:uncharacterized protein CbrC (UPF0167 family)
MEPPLFRYHPDPIATGMIVASKNSCMICEQARGYVYNGVPYCEEEVEELSICPWCISDGSAHDQLDAEFTDSASIGSGLVGTGPPPIEVIEEIAYRSPGFNAWQTECWFTHCDDGAAFIGAMGCDDLTKLGQEAVRVIRDSTGLDGEAWDDFFAALDGDGSPCAYLFRCLHCGQFGGYADAD